MKYSKRYLQEESNVRDITKDLAALLTTISMVTAVHRFLSYASLVYFKK